MADENTPLLWDSYASDDPHQQFCLLAGVPPSNGTPDKKHPFVIGPKTLYGRASRQYASARRNHTFMSALNNGLLLSQVILGATLTALGASESSHILITLFGVMNTVIAGLVAYMKSRGQPARTRLYRDDLENVVDQIENSEIMWLGISQNIHGYDEIDIDDKVTVRSEVARLMRLYERAHRSFVMSNPDNYLMGQSDGGGTALRSRAGIGGSGVPAPAVPALPTATPAAAAPTARPSTSTAPPPPEIDPDASPASAATEHIKDDGSSTAPTGDKKSPGPETAKPAADEDKADAKPAENASRDKPPSYTTSPDTKQSDSPPAKPDTSKAKPPATTPAAKSDASPAVADAQAIQAPADDPDASPAMAAKGFERGDSGGGSGKSEKGKGKEKEKE